MRVGIQILNYNGLKWLPGLLESLHKDSDREVRLYLVDNGSMDGSVDYVYRHHPDVAVIALGKNLGYGAAYTASMPQAFADGCDWVCLQNSDTLVTPGWLEPLRRAAAADSRIGIMGPVFWKWESNEPNYYMQGRCREMIPFMADAAHAPVDRDWIEGSSFFISRECHKQLGGFDPLYFMYWEDAEYCRRARLRGWRVVVVPGSICRHFAGGSAVVKGRSFPLLRNHLLYVMSDPAHGFVRNCFHTARLWTTYVKQTVWNSPNAVEFGRVLRAGFSALGHIGRCYRSRRAATVGIPL
jgi:GT2 family glycosyltransferase